MASPHSACWLAMANAKFDRARAGLPPVTGKCKHLGGSRWSFTTEGFTWTGEACCQHRARAQALAALLARN